MRRILLTLLFAISSALAIQTQAEETGGATVVRAEYFFDSDPGYGNATIINNVTEGDNQLSLSVEDLSPGAHMLYVRSQDSDGVWSSTQSHPLLLLQQRPTEAVRVEYFFDTDPGYGNGKSVGNLTDGDNTLVLSVEGLACGVHHLCLRAQDNTGIWSQVASSTLFIISPQTANAVRIEYFFDTDPGYGRATAITPSQDEEATYALSLDHLSMGAHMLYLRVQDNHGRWSAVQQHPIYVLSNLPDVVAVEYFFDDNDPGEGLATPVALPNMKMEPFAFEANIAGLAPGEHHLMVRLQKNNGFWTLYDAATFTVEGGAEPEAYAVLTDHDEVLTDPETGDVTQGKTLTFYYDDQKVARGGMSVGPFDYYTNVPWYDQREQITTVVFNDSFANCNSLTSTAYWFYECKQLTSITGLSNLKTENVTSMLAMFSSCHSLTSLDLSTLKTDNVYDMGQMFFRCYGLASIDMSGFKTDNVENMSYMFQECASLTSLDVSNFNTSKLTSMYKTFNSCSSLTSLDLSNFMTDKVEDMGAMFEGCNNLTTIYAGNGWSTASVTHGANMFSACDNLVGGKGTHYDVNHIDYTYARIDGGPNSETPGYFTDKNAAPAIAEAYAVLSENNTVLTFYYDDQKEARNGMEIGPFTYSYDSENGKDVINSGWDAQRDYITKAVFDASFADYTELTNTAYWFFECTNLNTIEGLSNLKTDNVTDMRYMFYYCSSLTSLDVSGFKTDNVTNMFAIFSGCESLTSLDVSGFKVENVTNMSSMFANCSSLTSLDVSGFKTENVTDMRSIFYGCSGLTSLDLSGFKMDNITDMQSMFFGCSGLTILDLSGFKTDNVKGMYGVFWGCSNLTTIYAGNDWSTVAVEDGYNMFLGCEKLVGGMGTTYDANHIDQEYARIDEGVANPGYFTPKHGYGINATFDGLVLTVGENTSMQAALEYVGGRDMVTATVAAVVWKDGNTALSNSDMQDFDNPNLLLYVSNKSLAPGNVKNVVVGDSVNGYKAQQIVLKDTESGNGNFFCPIPFTANRITYEREFLQYTQPDSCRGWETIVLPFAVQSIMHERNGALSPFANFGEERPFWLRELTARGFIDAAQIEANKPYIISMPNYGGYDMEYQLGGWVTFSAYACNVPKTILQTAVDSTNTIRFIPALCGVAQGDSVYALNVGEEYMIDHKKFAEGSVFVAGLDEVRPFRCYTQHVAAPAPSYHAPRYIPLAGWADSSTTLINEMRNGEWASDNDKWYMLDGRKLQSEPRQRGVYIRNQKKIKK